MIRALPICALSIALLSGGCRLIDRAAAPHGHSPLKPMAAGPDSVSLEIIWARFSPRDPNLNESVWTHIDETQIDPAAHRELARNGFRAGVISGTPPDAIARALNIDAYRPRKPADNSDGGSSPAELMDDPTVQRRMLQVHSGRRAEIQASDVLDSVPLLLSRGRELGGRTFNNAQAIYALRADPQPDQTVNVELTPELHYGQPRLRYTGGDEGILRQQSMRDREVFDAMRMSVRLAPGEMLVLMSLPDADCRLGHYFHTVDSANGPQQKLVLIRLAQVPRSDTFDMAAVR